MFATRTIPRRRSYFAHGTLNALRAARGTDTVAALENELAESFDLRNPVAVASGRIGLRLLLETSGLERGAEILLPGYTFGLLYPAVRASGFVPVAVDIDPDTFQMDSAKADEAATDRTGALLATHLFGEPCDTDRLLEVSRRRGILMIEDCAQAFGARRNGKMVGTIGDAGFASFDIAKPLQGVRGGAVFSGDAAWMGRVRERVSAVPRPAGATMEIARGFAEHALVQSFLWRVPMILFSFDFTQKPIVSLYRRRESKETSPGLSAQLGAVALPDVLACMVRLNLKSFGQRIERRRAIRGLYRELLGDAMAFQQVAQGDEGTVCMMVMRAPCDAFRLRRYLAIRGIDAAVGDEIADKCLDRSGSAVETVFREAIALPIHDALKDSDVRFVARVVKAGLRSCGDKG